MTLRCVRCGRFCSPKAVVQQPVRTGLVGFFSATYGLIRCPVGHLPFGLTEYKPE